MCCQLEKALEKCGTVNFFKFVVNPESFAQTVENLFYVSFLIRDGKVAYYIEDDEPMLSECLVGFFCRTKTD